MSDRPLLRRKLKERFQKIQREALEKSGQWYCRSGNRPQVLSEWKTLEKVLNRTSLSRYGDGEIKHMDGKRNVSQVFNPKLQQALTTVFLDPLKGHMVGIPNVFSSREFLDVRHEYIQSMRRRFGKIADKRRLYGSAYISRGDLCPYLAWATYWALISELWRDRDVVLVRGHEKRACGNNMMAQARNLSHIKTPSTSAWTEYDRIRKECLRHPVESIYLLCVGPTATVLAYDLTLSGRWAVDIGHLALFYRYLGKEHDDEPQVWNHRPTDPGYIKGVTDKC